MLKMILRLVQIDKLLSDAEAEIGSLLYYSTNTYRNKSVHKIARRTLDLFNEIKNVDLENL